VPTCVLAFAARGVPRPAAYDAVAVYQLADDVPGAFGSLRLIVARLVVVPANHEPFWFAVSMTLLDASRSTSCSPVSTIAPV
jgi:hypothetical protein